jgi:hypothetical protein
LWKSQCGRIEVARALDSDGFDAPRGAIAHRDPASRRRCFLDGDASARLDPTPISN